LFARAFINPGVNIDGFFAGNYKQLLNQTIGVAIAWGLSIVGTLVILFVVDKTIGLRVSEEDERMGLDLSQHGEEGYDTGGH
jgi:Amt family ammonium transporter